MAVLFYIVLALLVLSALGFAFTKANPRHLAFGLKYAGPSLLALFGLVLTLVGRAGVGMTLIGLSAAMFGRLGRSTTVQSEPGRYSTVRSAALEMELDLDTGDMNGLVLAARSRAPISLRSTRPNCSPCTKLCSATRKAGSS